MISAEAKDWASDCQGVEAPRPQVFAQKDTRQELDFIGHQKTARNTGRARRNHRGQGDEERDATIRDWQGTGPLVMASSGGERMCGWWSQA